MKADLLLVFAGTGHLQDIALQWHCLAARQICFSLLVLDTSREGSSGGSAWQAELDLLALFACAECA